MKTLLITVALVILMCSCKEKSQNELAIGKLNNGFAVEVKMEGNNFGIDQKNLEPIKKTLFKEDSVQLIFWEDGNPLKINFNLFNTDILTKGSATYTIPDVNAEKQKVDLNFFNEDRDVKRTNKRIIFRKGIIEIKKISNNTLQMTFEGEGSGMMEYGKNFPISGKVNVNY